MNKSYGEDLRILNRNLKSNSTINVTTIVKYLVNFLEFEEEFIFIIHDKLQFIFEKAKGLVIDRDINITLFFYKKKKTQ